MTTKTPPTEQQAKENFDYWSSLCFIYHQLSQASYSMELMKDGSIRVFRESPYPPEQFSREYPSHHNILKRIWDDVHSITIFSQGSSKIVLRPIVIKQESSDLDGGVCQYFQLEYRKYENNSCKYKLVTVEELNIAAQKFNKTSKFNKTLAMINGFNDQKYIYSDKYKRKPAAC